MYKWIVMLVSIMTLFSMNGYSIFDTYNNNEVREYTLVINVDSSDASIGVSRHITTPWEQVVSLKTGDQVDNLVRGGCTIGTLEASNTIGMNDNSWSLIRYFCRFDTSNIPANGKIIDISLFFYIRDKPINTGDVSWCIQEGLQGEKGTVEDFDAFTGDVIGKLITSNPYINGYVEVKVNPSIINKDGWSYFCIRQMTNDYFGEQPTGLNHFQYYGYGEQDKPPYLMVTYK